MNIKQARKTMREAFEDDPGFRKAYEANIAMLIYDNQQLTRKSKNRLDLEYGEDCNVLADQILKLIFEDKR